MFNNKEVLEYAGLTGNTAWRYSMYWDIIVVTAIILLFGGVIPLSYILMYGDWSFWIDWRDRQFWPLVVPIVAIWYPAALGGIFWANFRLPIGATVGAVLLIIPTWLSRWGTWVEFNGYPISMVMPEQIIAGGLILDGAILVLRSYVFAAIVGGFLFGFTFYFANYGVIAGFYQPVEHLGSIAPVADVIAYTFPRSSTPEYLRIIERGTLRTFGDNTVFYTAAFAGYACVLMYLIWWKIGVWFAQATFFPNASWIKDAVGLKD